MIFLPTINATFEDDLLAEASMNCPFILLNIKTYGPSIYSIFRRIRRLGLSTTKPWADRADRVAISNTLFDTEHDILLLSSQLRPDTKNKRSNEQKNPDIISIADVLITSAQLFIFLAIRAMPIQVRVVEIQLGRIQAAIERDHLQEIWQEHCSIEALLWTLFVSAVAATGRPERSRFIAELRAVSTGLPVSNRRGMELTLRKFGWSDFLGQNTHTICEEIFGYQFESIGAIGLST
jgi:hypothetical protein